MLRLRIRRYCPRVSWHKPDKKSISIYSQWNHALISWINHALTGCHACILPPPQPHTHTLVKKLGSVKAWNVKLWTFAIPHINPSGIIFKDEHDQDLKWPRLGKEELRLYLLPNFFTRWKFPSYMFLFKSCSQSRNWSCTQNSSPLAP